MAEKGSSVLLNWGEDDGLWECSWITGGKRFTGYSSESPFKAISIAVKEVNAEIIKCGGNADWMQKLPEKAYDLIREFEGKECPFAARTLVSRWLCTPGILKALFRPMRILSCGRSAPGEMNIWRV